MQVEEIGAELVPRAPPPRAAKAKAPPPVVAPDLSNPFELGAAGAANVATPARTPAGSAGPVDGAAEELGPGPLMESDDEVLEPQEEHMERQVTTFL